MEAIKMKKDDGSDAIDVTSVMSMLSDKKVLKKENNVVELNAHKGTNSQEIQAANDSVAESVSVNAKSNPAFKAITALSVLAIIGYLLYAVFATGEVAVSESNEIDWDGVRNILTD